MFGKENGWELHVIKINNDRKYSSNSKVNHLTTSSKPVKMATYLFMFVIISSSVFNVFCRSVESGDNGLGTTDEGRSSDYAPFSTDLKFLYRVYSDCSQKELSSCLKTKLVTAIDRAARSNADIKVAEGVSFVKDPSATDITYEDKPLNEAELEESLPRDLEDKEDQLDELIFDKILGFLKSHTLQFKMTSVEEFQRSLNEE
ncbi:hypothetical protein L9F63_006355, partial [Diploptera punctata]